MIMAGSVLTRAQSILEAQLAPCAVECELHELNKWAPLLQIAHLQILQSVAH